MQNAVTNYNGEVVGYRCRVCSGVFDSMWSDTCNGCRDKERQHKEMIAAIKSTKKCCSCGCHTKDKDVKTNNTNT